MNMPNIQSSTTSTNASAANAAVNSSMATPVKGEESTGTFVEALTKMIKEQSTEEQAEIADTSVAIATGVIPSAIMMVVHTTQPTAEEIKTTAQNLLNLVQFLDPEKLQSLLEQPTMTSWVNKAEHNLTTVQSINLTTVQSTNLPPNMVQLPTASTLIDHPVELKSVMGNERITVLNRYLQLLETNPTNPVILQLGSELKMMTSELTKSFPAIAATYNVELPSSEATKMEKPSHSGLSAIQQWVDSTMKNTSGDTKNHGQDRNGSQSQLLQRLAFLSPNVQTAVIETILGHAAATSVDASTLTVDSMITNHDDVTITLTQLTDTQKLSAVSTEAKAFLHSLPAQHFAEEMTRFLVKNMRISQLNGISEAKISLIPEHLGQVDVRISVHNGQITAHFVAESSQARDLLELQLPQLRAALQQQGLQVEKLDIHHQNNLGSGLFQDQKHQQASQQFTQNGKKKSQNYDQSGTDFSLEVEQATRSRLAYGNTFNAIA
jgi:flagellar hook-length control protein FliK